MRPSLRRLPRPRSLRQRIVLSTVAVVTVAMVAVGLGLQLVLDVTARRDVSQVLRERSDAVVPVLERESGPALTVPDDALEPGEQVVAADGTVVAGSVPTWVRDTASDLAASVAGTSTPRSSDGGDDDDVRLRATPYTTAGGQQAVLVVSQDSGPYERSEFYALLATLVLGLLVIGGTALVALRVTRQALVPVREMAARAEEWSTHDLAERFGTASPDRELAALGETLDHLLDRVASAILSEQRLTAELAHELRTPLTSVQGSAELALLRGIDDPELRADVEQIAASAQEMTRVIATLLDLARDGVRPGRERTCVVADVVDALAEPPRRVPVEVDVAGSSARVAAPADLVVRAVAPLVDNAARHARSLVRVEVRDHDDHVALRVVDDGPGVDPDLRATLFEPGVTSGTDGAGLGLGIARRVAGSFGGSIVLDDQPVDEHPGGAAFVVRLPRR